MTTFGIFVVGCWVGFALGLLFAGTAGMLSRREDQAQERPADTMVFDRTADVPQASHRVSRI